MKEIRNNLTNLFPQKEPVALPSPFLPGYAAKMKYLCVGAKA